MAAAPYRLSLRIYLPNGLRLGPGKIALLQAVAAQGSISAAARAQRISYKRAWDLLEEMNRLLEAPVIETMQGGKTGGGARLTATGIALLAHYQAVLDAAETQGSAALKAIAALGQMPEDAPAH
ncbi:MULTISPECIES: winged helix-turn-helix domain-containing protein [unclassified Acidocella]|uniref:winged helix-turn-helix domain-containing protein n=1 Tax=unclassified Acidocella TaxID=2648610 RepID=UPI00028E146F|nr:MULTISPECIES: LysR family transcriptional regulator [unclassified Acidocella]EKM99952.1 ModE family transcriptional regulator [Acidocella sp. MX-AZ02]WBO59554.1 LysR family transcriptional regulator [Acidocella sp. MX-AZ03]